MTPQPPQENNRPLAVVFTGGGTGGHLYPALALAKKLQAGSPTARLLFIGSGRLEANKVPEAGYPFKKIAVRGLAGSWGLPGLVRKAHAALLLGLGVPVWQSLFHLLRFRPDVVVGTGGYVCGPVMLAARLLGIPSISVEQNVRPGLTTRALARLVDVAALVAEDSIEHYPKPAGLFSRPGKPELVVVGNPVRDEFFSATKEAGRAAFGLAAERLTVLVFGGSLGSAIINRTFFAALEELSDEYWLRTGVQFVHVAGKQAQAADGSLRVGPGVKAQKARVRWQGYAYLDNLPQAFAAADLAVCRGGGTTVAELAAAGLPAIIIPWAQAANNEQYHNARPLARSGGAVIIPEEELTAGRLAAQLRELLQDRGRLQEMAAAARALGRPQAAQDIIALVRKLARRA